MKHSKSNNKIRELKNLQQLLQKQFLVIQ